jgi:hypothetical protein
MVCMDAGPLEACATTETRNHQSPKVLSSYREDAMQIPAFLPTAC